jgi:23S rRNA (guanosine2251-2'-O)-methyltransferase
MAFPEKNKKRFGAQNKKGVRGNFSQRRSEEFTPRDDEDENECIISGRNAVKELLSGGRDIEKIFVQSGEREGSINLLIGMAAERKIQIREADKRKLDELSGGARHQGIVAIPAERNYYSVDDILAYAEERGEKPLILMLDGITDPHNLGAIIRSAECCGAHGVIIPKRRSVGLTTVVAKSSAGALEHVRVAKVTNLAQTVDELKERGLWFYLADMNGSPYYETELTSPTVIVMGSEGFGISRLVKEKCDFVISVPMYGSLNSMNVSCAATVVMAEVARQRNK